MRSSFSLVSLATALVAGCASERPRGPTWAEDREEGVPSTRERTETRASSPPSRKKTLTLGQQTDAREESVSAPRSEDLELALLRFTSKRRALSAEEPPRDRPALAPDPRTSGKAEETRKAPAPPTAWPRPMEAAWDAVLRELEGGFSQPRGSVPRRVLIQARVTLEVEREITETRHGRAPPSIADRITRLFAGIALHMRSSPPLSEEKPRRAKDLKLSWPVSPVIVTSPFGYRRDPILGRSDVRFHAGVDLGGEMGDLVHAAAPGRVASAGWLGGHGRTIIVQHPGGYQTVYAHLRQILTSLGAAVDPGTPVGLMGTSGRSTGPHLHFEVRQGGVPIDPLDAVDFEYSGIPRSDSEDREEEAKAARARAGPPRDWPTAFGIESTDGLGGIEKDRPVALSRAR